MLVLLLKFDNILLSRYFGTTKEVEEAKEQEALANGGGVLLEEEEEEIKPATLNGEVGELSNLLKGRNQT